MNKHNRHPISILLFLGFFLGSCTPVQSEEPEIETPTQIERPLSGTQWQLSAYGKMEVLQPASTERQPSLTFGEAEISGKTGCNNYSANYILAEGTITLERLFWTEMECLGPGLMEQEKAYLSLLSSIETYQLDGDTLILVGPDGTLRFEPVVSPAERTLVRKLWRLEAIVEQKGIDVIAERIDERFVITAWFEDRRIGGKTGCNNYSTPYEITGEGLDMTSGPMEMTAAGCIDEESASLEKRFIEALQAAETYHIDRDQLTITFPDGELVFTAQEKVFTDENAVYTTLIQEWDGGLNSYVIFDQTRFNKPGVTIEETLTFVREQLPTEVEDDLFALDTTTLIDFEQKNAVPSSVNEVLNIGFPVTFIVEEEIDEIFNAGEDTGWAVFHENYPDSQGIYTFSRVGFNEDGDQALAYLGIQKKDFTGGYYSLLVERDGLWSSVISFMTWSQSN